MDILNDYEQKKLEEMKEFFQKISFNFKNLPREDAKEIQYQTESIYSAICSFGSEKFVVTCIGMLKSGKSTLVNLFSRNELASPAGFGFDTTLRPALITDTDASEGSIEIWIPSKPEEDSKEKEKILDDVFSCLRGIKKAEEVKDATLKTYPLSEEKLKEALCKKVSEAANNMLTAEPVMVVVKVPKDPESLLNDEITILDTPGLDSGESAWTEKNEGGSEQYHWIIKNSDLFLFLQSSVAPLNQKAKDVLDLIKEQKKPIWLIQNTMIIKPWYSDDDIKRENDKQRAAAAAMFDQVNKTFKKFFANLGKAATAVFDENYDEKKESRNDLLDNSEFLSLEQHIRDDLKQNSHSIRREVCVESVKAESKKLSNLISRNANELEQEKGNLESQVDKLRLDLDVFRDILFNPEPGKMYRALSSDKEIYISEDAFKKNEFLRILQYAYDLDFKQDKYSAEELSKIIKNTKVKLVNSIKESLEKIKLSDFQFILQGNDDKINSPGKFILSCFKSHISCLSNEKKFCDDFTNYINEVSGEIELPALPDSLDVFVDQLDHIDVKVDPIDSLLNKIIEIKKRTTEAARKIFGKYYDTKMRTGDFVDLIDSCQKKMKENLLNWVNKTAYEHLRRQFIDKLEEKIKRSNDKKQEEIESLENDLENMNEFITLSNKVQKTMESF